jgi:type IV fimbrial biogenesis protein FimT
MRERGASLVELVMVMGLVGILTAVTGEGLVSAALSRQSYAVVTDVAAELRAARYLAVFRRERLRVVCVPGGTSIRIERADVPGGVLRTYHFPARGTVIDHVSNGPAIYFQASGRAASPTTVMLRDDRGRRWAVTVSLTGRVSII